MTVTILKKNASRYQCEKEASGKKKAIDEIGKPQI